MSLTPQLVLYEEDHKKVTDAAARLCAEANARAVFLVDKNGQMIAEAGALKEIDTTSLASLVAGTIAASGGLAKVLGEEEFPSHFHQGERDNVYITVVAQRVILVVIFDEQSSLGLVRLRVKKAGQRMAELFEAIYKRAERDLAEDSPFADLTQDDIDNLFQD
jgi:predicted regulator of Ras-like GTPase activity (Roadblock/LC7/MglB family)